MAPADPSRFILLCHQRSGSNALTSAISRQSEVALFGQLFLDHPVGRKALRELKLPMYARCPGYDRLFNRHGRAPSKWLELRLRSYRRTRDLDAFVENFYRRFHEVTGARALGFKLHDYQLSDADFERVMRDFGAKIVVLHRRNLLAAAVSWCVAVQTQHWVRGRAEHDAPGQLEIDVDEVRWFVERTREGVDRWHRQLASLGVEHLELVYEDVFAPGGLDPFWDFLGAARPADATPRTRKLMTPERYRRISNIESVERALGSERNGYLLRA